MLRVRAEARIFIFARQTRATVTAITARLPTMRQDAQWQGRATSCRVCHVDESGRLPLLRLRQYDGRMSFSETVFLFFLALIIFGPKKLPEIARQVGKYLNEFKRASNEFKAQIEQEIAHLETDTKQTILPPSYPPVGAMSRSLEAGPASESVPTQAEPATLAAPTGETAVVADTNADDSQPAATEAIPADPVTSSTSQESHA
jgi:TatA/E family protein of Tat protein translocase